ncbi:MAG: TlpA family protein disulfide reductase [Prevotellaceae bacterium]|jgi:thiol-disulfide isomerase/thioredoxin|nr:TlpA family protein disulfide reductase [Prevotellaceae bacterium]
MNKLSALLVTLALVACKVDQNNENLTVASGKWERDKPEKIYLYKAINGELKEIASSSLSDDSVFCFALKPATGGFYHIGPGKFLHDRYTFYLKPGDRLNVTVNDTSYVLNGNNSAENRELTKWHDFVQPVEWKAVYFDKAKSNSTYVDFFPLLEEKTKVLGDYPKNVTANEAFNSAFEEYRNFNFADLAIHYIYTPRSAHPEGEDFPEYYRKLDLAALSRTTAIMNYPQGTDVLERIIFNNLRMENVAVTDPVEAIMNNIPNIVNDTLKGEFAAKFLSQKRTYAGLLDVEEKYGKYLVTDKQRNMVRERKLALNETKDGNPATDFKFPDKDGKPVALSDFKGKLVYIDIWATWCGPCKQELPHLKKLEAEYHGNNNIVFLSVSTDASKDYQKWKDFLAKEDLKGVQLFGGDDSRQGIIQPYKVSGIPRFVLVGKDGRIVAADAPRPSSSEIRALLKANL